MSEHEAPEGFEGDLTVEVDGEPPRTARTWRPLNLPSPYTKPSMKFTSHAKFGKLAKVVDDQQLDAAVQLPVSTVAFGTQLVLNSGDTDGLAFW